VEWLKVHVNPHTVRSRPGRPTGCGVAVGTGKPTYRMFRKLVGLHVPTATPHPVGFPGRERTVCGFTCTYSHSTPSRSHWT
jgi:hypothetical protein